MPTFSYKAIDSHRRTITGEIDADSLTDAKRRIEAQGLQVETLALSEGRMSGLDTTSAPRVQPAEPRRDEEVSLSPKEFEVVGERIAELTRAQLPLAPGIAALAAEMPDRRLKRGMKALSRKLERGLSLEEAIATSGASKEFLAVVRAGARSGRTSELLAGYVAHQRSRSSVRFLIMLSLGYPLVLLTAAGGIVAFFLTYLVPSFKKIFTDFGTELPSLTLTLIKLSDFLVTVGWKIAVGSILVVIVVAIVGRLFGGRGAWQPLLRMLPLVGPLVHWSSMARFCHMLAVMIENRVPLPEALQLSADGTNDSGIRAACREMIAQVTGGAPPAPSQYFVSGFPAAMIRTLTEQKQTDALPATLHAVADMYDSRARLHGNLALVIFGPIVIAIAGFTVFTIVGAMFLPLVKLINVLA